jgi:hypothetical protein
LGLLGIPTHYGICRFLGSLRSDITSLFKGLVELIHPGQVDPLDHPTLPDHPDSLVQLRFAHPPIPGIARIAEIAQEMWLLR